MSCVANSSIRATALSCTAAAAAPWLSTQLGCSFSPPDVGTFKDTMPWHHTNPNNRCMGRCYPGELQGSQGIYMLPLLYDGVFGVTTTTKLGQGHT